MDLSSLLAAPIPFHPPSFPFPGKCWGRTAVPHPGTTREEHLVPWHRAGGGSCSLLLSPPHPTQQRCLRRRWPSHRLGLAWVCLWPRTGLQNPCSLFQVAVPGRCACSASGNSRAVSCSSIGLFSGHKQRLQRQNVQVCPRPLVTAGQGSEKRCKCLFCCNPKSSLSPRCPEPSGGHGRVVPSCSHLW